MKKITLLLGAMVIGILWTNAQAPDWMWANSAGNMSYDAALATDADAMGNSYVAGYFNVSIEFGSYILTSAGSGDIYIVKYDPDGNVLWAKSAGGSSDERATGIAVDDLGYCYVTGYYKSTTMMLDAITLTNASVNSFDMFVAKYNPNGDVSWARGNGGTGDDRAYAIAIDTTGSCMVAGYYVSPSMTFGATTLNNTGNVDLFMAKYAPDGTALWARSAAGTGPDYATALAVDKFGNTFMTGYFTSATLTFGADILTIANVSFSDMFIVKYDVLGNLLWVDAAGGNLAEIGTSVAVDTFGNCFVGGTFKSPSLQFGTTTLVNLTTSTEDLFLAKYDVIGEVSWALSAGGAKGDGINGLATDDAGTIYAAGYFKSEELELGEITLTNTNDEYADVLIAAFNPNGIPRWAKSAGGSADDFATTIAVDPTGVSFLGGYFGTTIIFGDDELISAGTSDMFLAKSDMLVDITGSNNEAEITIYPVPCTREVHFVLGNHEPAYVLLFDVSGKKILEIQFTDRTTVNTAMFASGMYVYHIVQEGHIVHRGQLLKQ